MRTKAKIIRRNTGILIKCSTTNNFFLLKRAFEPYKGIWSLLSGGIDENEDSLTAIKREIWEEISINAEIISIQHKTKEINPSTGTEFEYYIGIVESEFIPTLNIENSEYIWASIDNLPLPLYPNLTQKLNFF